MKLFQNTTTANNDLLLVANTKEISEESVSASGVSRVKEMNSDRFFDELTPSKVPKVVPVSNFKIDYDLKKPSVRFE